MSVQQVAVRELRLADDNVRDSLGDLRELTASIKAVGVLEPLLVRDSDKLVVCGARRLEAAKKAGLKEVPALLRPFTEDERVQVMLIENLQRSDLTALEQGRAFRRLQELGHNQKAIAAQVGISQGTVSKRLALVALPDKVQEAIGKGEISLEEAGEIAKLKDDPKAVARVVKKAAAATVKQSSQSRVGYAVQQEARKKERDAKIAKAKRAFKAKGEPVVDLSYDEYGYMKKPPKGMAFVNPNGYRDDEVVMKPSEHAKLPCHAIGVDPQNFNAVEICSDPSKHPNRKEQREKKEEADAKRRLAEEEALGEATQRRWDWLAVHLKGKPEEKVIIDACLHALSSALAGSGYYSPRPDEIAAELLGLEPEEEDEGIDPISLLNEFGDRSGADKLRVAYAVALGFPESRLGYKHEFTRQHRYFEFLVEQGYALSEYEAALMPESGEDAASTDEEEGDDDGS